MVLRNGYPVSAFITSCLLGSLIRDGSINTLGSTRTYLTSLMLRILVLEVKRTYSFGHSNFVIIAQKTSSFESQPAALKVFPSWQNCLMTGILSFLKDGWTSREPAVESVLTSWFLTIRYMHTMRGKLHAMLRGGLQHI
jgi:hypothetical protein